MSSKIFSLFAFGILALVLVAGLASAVSLNNITVYTIPTSVNEGIGSFKIIFDLTNTGVNGTLDFSASTVSTGSLAFNDTTIANGSGTPVTEAITATVTFSTAFSGTISGVINVTGTGMSTSKTLPFSVAVNSVSPTIPAEITACTAVGNSGNLDIKKIDFTNNGVTDGQTFGKDDEWFPLENIEVQIDVKNQGNSNEDKVNNIEVNWGIYDTDAKQWIIELVDEKDFDLKNGKTNTMTISFSLDENDLDVDLSDLTDGDHYIFYVTAQGEVDDASDTSTCTTDSEAVSVIVESDFVMLDNIQIQETAQCGANVEISADAWNIGDSDQDDVSVQFFNKDLGINQKVSVGDIDAFDKKKVSFSFTAPKNLEEKTYSITAEVLNEDDDVYQNDFNDDNSEFNIPLAIKGGCTGSESSATVTANLVSGGKAGQDLVVEATVTNSGTSSATYVISASGHAQWASTYNVQPSTLALAAGASGKATYTFKVNNDASGDQTFYIEIVSGTQVTRQPVSVTIEKSGFFGSITGGAISENAWVWGLGLLNVILIIVIILVAIRVTRK